MKPCRDDQVRNPATQRCVSRTGAIGKRILRANRTNKANKPPGLNRLPPNVTRLIANKLYDDFFKGASC